MPNKRLPVPVNASFSTNTVCRAAPTSTTNMTGFFATIRGLSLTSDSHVARLIISGSKSGRVRTPLEMSSACSGGLISGLGSSTGTLRVDILEHLSIEHLEVLDDRPQR